MYLCDSDLIQDVVVPVRQNNITPGCFTAITTKSLFVQGFIEVLTIIITCNKTCLSLGQETY